MVMCDMLWLFQGNWNDYGITKQNVIYTYGKQGKSGSLLLNGTTQDMNIGEGNCSNDSCSLSVIWLWGRVTGMIMVCVICYWWRVTGMIMVCVICYEGYSVNVTTWSVDMLLGRVTGMIMVCVICYGGG